MTTRDDLPTSNSSILEDDERALFGEAQVEEQEEMIDLEAGKPVIVADAPAQPVKAQPKAKPVAAAAADADELPEGLRGKTPSQLAKMYADAQSVIGRQGKELGDLRRHADLVIQQRAVELAQRQTTAKPAVEKKEVADADFFANPKATVGELVKDIIANHHEIKQLRGESQRLAAENLATKQATNEQAFNGEFSDAGTTLADPAFRSWVNASPIRQRLLLAAHKNYDLAAAREVFGTWNELKATKTVPAGTAVSDAARTLAASRKKSASQAAAVPSGANAAQGDGSKKKIYSRVQILDMMENDPERYQAMSGEIQRAYEEKRVR